MPAAALSTEASYGRVRLLSLFVAPTLWKNILSPLLYLAVKIMTNGRKGGRERERWEFTDVSATRWEAGRLRTYCTFSLVRF